MPLISSDYRGPLIVVAIGAGFLLVGAVPVAITYGIGVRTSAKIIGMGFVGFGLLLMLPGLCWCVWVRVQAFRKRHWPSKSSGNNASNSADAGMGSMDGLKHEDDRTHGERTDSNARRSARTRSWPSTYSEPPVLIVADNEVCNAAICVQPSTMSSPPPTATAAVNNGGVAPSVDSSAAFDPDQHGTSTLTAGHPPPVRTQRSDPGPTERTAAFDQSVTSRPRTVDADADEAPP